MDYITRKLLSKYLMNTIDFNKHNINFFINDTWQKYVGVKQKSNSLKTMGQLKIILTQPHLDWHRPRKARCLGTAQGPQKL